MILLALIMIKGWRRNYHMIIIIIIIIIQIIQIFRVRSRSYVRSRQLTGRRLLSYVLISVFTTNVTIYFLVLFLSDVIFLFCFSLSAHKYLSVCVRAYVYVYVLRVRVVLNHVIQFYSYHYYYFCFYFCFRFSCFASEVR